MRKFSEVFDIGTGALFNGIYQEKYYLVDY